MQNLIRKKWAPVLKPHMCHFWSPVFSSFNDIYIANWCFFCVSCNFFSLHMRFCIWPLKLHMMFFPPSDAIVCSFVSPEFDTYEVLSLTFFTTYEVLHLTSELTYEFFPRPATICDILHCIWVMSCCDRNLKCNCGCQHSWTNLSTIQTQLIKTYWYINVIIFLDVCTQHCFYSCKSVTCINLHIGW